MNTRMLGSAGIAGGLCLFIVELRHIVTGVPVGAETIDRFDALLYALWSIGMICTLWAIYKLDVMGNHAVLRLAPIIPMLGFAVGVLFSLLQAVGVVAGTNPAFGLFWILVMVGLLLTGIVVLVARRWTGWRKFAPLACILVIPVMIGLSSVVGTISNLMFSLAQMVLGVAVFTSTDVPIEQRSVVH